MQTQEIAVVTGANGFVGSHLVDNLLSKGLKVRCLVRKSSNLRWLDGKNVEIFNSGLSDKDGLRKAFKDANYIFHVAGVVKSKTAEGYFKGNVDTTRNLLEVALESKSSIKRFLVVSSQTVSGPSTEGKPVNEETECNPITTYGRSKLEEEKLALSYKDKLPITICRAPAVYGERDTEIFIYFQTFNKGLTTTIGFNKKELSLIHVVDLVEGFYLAAMSEKAVGQIYFIGSEKFYTWQEINSITSKVLNKKPIIIKVPHFLVYTIASVAQFFAMFSSKPATLNIEKAKDITQQYWTCDTSKAIRDLGYKQKISIEDGIKRTCDWYKEMKWI
ncbi:MAG: NAD(P)-dependent oxidoreductase [Ignavibacteriaceae bacterium]|nr:NAD(P)-dependent oxidoreductase [Ignavibacterium sp.]MCC6253364.1 NAD(P)-dependent oxidoreductase [Ignavibacteriaceae bacterium]HRN27304.1 NAD(P)-dependent oxidoreductase [Ignavibacteriaceae bacterium]HRQ53746.1 NAD(P)-dependent oxidoreductase [Ignavibacteriaceae bacterium]